jgi:hypothetical protein
MRPFDKAVMASPQRYTEYFSAMLPTRRNSYAGTTKAKLQRVAAIESSPSKLVKHLFKAPF